MAINSIATLVGLLNAMIGGTMLIIPILALTAGTIQQLFFSLVLGLTTAYTAYLLVSHLGTAKNIKHLILGHFGEDVRVTSVYNVMIWFSFTSAMIVYFNLFCVQVGALFGRIDYLPEILALVLILWTGFLRETDLSEIVLASGITSIVGFFAFLTFMSIKSEADKRLPLFGENTAPLTLGLLNSFTTHDFLIQVIISNPNRGAYRKIVLLLYFIGTACFIYAAFFSNTLLNMRSSSSNPETIIDFFEGVKGQSWHLTILECLYIFHIFSAFPEYVMVSKIRIFQLLNIEHNSKDNISFGEAFYITVVVLVCYSIKKLNVPLKIILDISGAVIGYIFAIFFPTLLHFKCLHFDVSSGMIEGDEQRNLAVLKNRCDCDLRYRSRWTFWAQTCLLCFVALFGGTYLLTQLASELHQEGAFSRS